MRIPTKVYKKVLDTKLTRRLYPDYMEDEAGFIKIPIEGTINASAKIEMINILIQSGIVNNLEDYIKLLDK